VTSFRENSDTRHGGGSRGGCRRGGRGQPSVRERVEPGQRWLAQMRETISLTGRLEPEDLTRRCGRSSPTSTAGGGPNSS